jgi:hypothetical protein
MKQKRKRRKNLQKRLALKKSSKKVINNHYYSSNYGYGLSGIRPSYSLPSSSPNIINNNINNNITVGGNDGVDGGTSPEPTSESVEFKYLKKFSLEEDSE